MQETGFFLRPVYRAYALHFTSLFAPEGGVRKSIIGAVSALTALWLTSACAQAEELKAYLETIRVQNKLPALAAAVVKNGEIVEAAATGTRIAGQDIPVSLDDKFHIGSNTKAMTATLAGMMVDEGTLTWKSTIGEILGEKIPGMSGSLQAATLEQLLSHSSGIPSDDEEIAALYYDTDAFDHDVSEVRRRIVDRWKDNELEIPEGSPFQYSNLGYIIAGLMIEEVSGTTWEQLIRECIFQPLSMTTAGLGAQATYGLIDAPVGHQLQADGTVTPIKWGPAADAPPSLGPAGIAHMSISDYAKWAGWNAAKGTRGPQLVKPETLAEIQSVHVETPPLPSAPPGTPGTGGYGLGWGMIKFDWAEKRLLAHSGSNSMNLAKILVDQDQDLAVVVTTNFPGRQADDALSGVLGHLYKQYAQ